MEKNNDETLVNSNVPKESYVPENTEPLIDGALANSNVPKESYVSENTEPLIDGALANSNVPNVSYVTEKTQPSFKIEFPFLDLANLLFHNLVPDPTNTKFIVGGQITTISPNEPAKSSGSRPTVLFMEVPAVDIGFVKTQSKLK